VDKEIKKGKVGMGKGMWLQKLKTPMKTRFANKVIMFEEVVEFKEAILLCHG
jgi:hypothetical protein